TIAPFNGVQIIGTLTGFKNIGEKIYLFDTRAKTIIKEIDENYGYLISNLVRDRDGVQGSVMTCDIAYYCNRRSMSYLEALDLLYEQHGYYQEGMTSITIEDIEGSEKIAQMMATHRDQKPTSIGGLRVEKVEDYLESQRVNVLTDE